MRISDWSSDVCSSDLFIRLIYQNEVGTETPSEISGRKCARRPGSPLRGSGASLEQRSSRGKRARRERFPASAPHGRCWRSPPQCASSSTASAQQRSEAHTAELKSQMSTYYAVFVLKK